MKFRYGTLLVVRVMCFTLFLGLVASSTRLAAQETATGNTENAGNNPADNDHDRGPQNGDLAVSAVTVLDGAYASSQIATLPKDGGPYHFLTTVDRMPNGAFDPDFTSDGRTIFFWSFGAPDSIYSVPTRGGRITQIHTDCIENPNCFGDDNPAISPNSRELLAVRFIGPFDQNGCLAFAGIMLFHSDGSHSRQLTPSGPECTGDDEPRWSSDGNWIVFRHGEANGLISVWIMRRDGSHRRQVTPGTTLAYGNPNWSPDGDRIVFQIPAEPTDDQNPQQVYTIHPDGTHFRQITHYAIIPGVTIATFGSRWSPDGKKLVFSHRDPNTTQGPDGLPHSDIFEMNPDGSDVVQITFSPEKDNNTAWGSRR
jgi:Tol biopolymer transport system component